MVSKKNPDPAPMKDTINDEGAWNGGFETTSAKDGQKIIRAFGLDRSTDAGTRQDERETMRGVGGSVTNIAHSLGGATVNQTGRSKR